MMNENIFKERTLFPLSEPDSAGKQKKINIKPGGFDNAIEQMDFNFSFNKGEGIYFSARIRTCYEIIDALQDVLRNQTKQTISFDKTGGKRGTVSLHVGRDENMLPFMALSGDINGQRRNKKFFWFAERNFVIKRDGQPLSDLEIAERGARAFTRSFMLFVDHLAEKYAPAEYKQGGGQFGQGGYQRNQQSGGGYTPNQNRDSAPQTTSQFDDIL